MDSCIGGVERRIDVYWQVLDGINGVLKLNPSLFFLCIWGESGCRGAAASRTGAGRAGVLGCIDMVT